MLQPWEKTQLGKCYTSTSGYDCGTAIAKFYNRDADNAVGFEMRMTQTEYHTLSRFIEQVCKDVADTAQRALAERVRSQLPTGDAGG